MSHTTSASSGTPDDAGLGDYGVLIDELTHHVVAFFKSRVDPMMDGVARTGGDPRELLEVVALTLYAIADGLGADVVALECGCR